MNRFLHDDLCPKNLTLSLGKMEELKEKANLIKDISSKLSSNLMVEQKDELTKPEVTTYPKLGSEMTKPILLFVG